MDSLAFINWALDPARTVEERYTVEELVEVGVGRWNAQRKIYEQESWDDRMARQRERKLNPAYQPAYDRRQLEQTAEALATNEQWLGHSDRPLRSIEVLRFFPALREITLHDTAVEDLSPLTELPHLRKLSLGSLGHDFGNPCCRDFRPLARCTALEELALGFNVRWPDLTGLETLPKLEKLSLSGNLLALPKGVVFPKVKRAVIYCLPLSVRSVAELPQVPGCEFLDLSGVETLEGIEQWPHLRNLTLRGAFESFEPLTALQELTWLTVLPNHKHRTDGQPRNVEPVARIPKLHFFQIGPPLNVLKDMPRDFFPLANAPALRELVVLNCPPVEMEVAAIQAGLPPWDDLFLRPEPRAIPPLRVVVATRSPLPVRPPEHAAAGETGLIDVGLRECEGRWVRRYLHRQISEKLGQRDWGTASAYGLGHGLYVEIHSYDVVEKLPLILDATRETMAWLRAEYEATVMINLRVPSPPPSPAQKALNDKLRDEQDRWEYEERLREQEEYQERLHQLELKKEEGGEINPEEFSPQERSSCPVELPPEPAEDDEDSADDDDGDGEVAVQQAELPKMELFDDEHPLAGNYRLMADFTLDTLWIRTHHKGIALHLLGREADEEIPDEKEHAEGDERAN
jgi:hypothetical protein